MPVDLRDTSYAGHQRLGSGKGYRYPHEYPGHYLKQEYRPKSVEHEEYYIPGLAMNGGFWNCARNVSSRLLLRKERKNGMIDRSVASAILSKCLRGGADFAELFFEERREGVIGMLSGEIEAATSALELGVGLRVMRGLKSVYTYGNDLGEQGLDALAVNALAALKVAPMEARMWC